MSIYFYNATIILNNDEYIIDGVYEVDYPIKNFYGLRELKDYIFNHEQLDEDVKIIINTITRLE